jgi:hypothetical protein
MLLYHPAFDIYHCCFRLLRLLNSLPHESHEIEKIRILDLYLLLPTLLQKVAFPHTAKKYKPYIKNLEIPYENIENPYKLLIQLEPIQRSALRHLASCNIIDPNSLIKEKVLKTDAPIPQDILNKIEQSDSEMPDLIGLLTGPLFDMEFYGDTGLKARSRLMEYKYDAK